MICIHLKNTDPYFCLAAEEYLLKNFSEDIFMLWQSENTVVVGKHQNTLAEINYPFVRENKIKIARRISGGGTVFHDSGNLNFVFIKNVKSPAEINFKKFTSPIVAALGNLGISATTSGKNDLLINSLKISGNAGHVFKNRVLHHGTLLYNSDLENLGQAIKVGDGKYESKAIQSNRSSVVNIFSFLDKKLSLEEFIKYLLDFQLKKNDVHFYELSGTEMEKIKALSLEKFKTWEWIFGYSPRYSFQNRTVFNGNEINIDLKAVKGLITEINIQGTYFINEVANELSDNLLNKKHYFEDVQHEVQRVLGKVPDGLSYAFF